MFCFFRSAVRVKQFLFLLLSLSLFGHSHTLSKRTQLFGVRNEPLRSINQKVVLLVLLIHFLPSTSSKLYDSFHASFNSFSSRKSLLCSSDFAVLFLQHFQHKWLGCKHTWPETPSSGERARFLHNSYKKNTLCALLSDSSYFWIMTHDDDDDDDDESACILFCVVSCCVVVVALLLLI